MTVRLIACLTALLLLSGCTSPVEELFSMPELPAEFAEFNDQLNVIRAGGAEFCAPISGFNRQSVQLMDLDNDGVDEGIAFATKNTDRKRALVYVFKKQGDTYQVHEEIEGAGNIVESVSYADIMGNGNYELIIGWGLEDNGARTLTAYEIEKDGMQKLVEVPYLYCVETDMDGDGVTDLNVVMPDEQNKSPELAMYSRGMGELRFRSAAPLSQGINEIKKIRAGYGADGMPAIFVDSSWGDNQMLTDMIILKDGQLINATRDEKTGASEATRRSFSVNCEDADGDGIIEIPAPEALPGHETARLSGLLYGITWQKYDERTLLRDSYYTYHDYVDSWHIVLPLKWKGRVTAERLTRDRGIMFYSVEDGYKKNLLFSVYVLTGESRYAKAAYSGRIQLAEKQNVIYSATINKEAYLGVDITEDSLREMFRWRETEWSSGEVVA